MTESAPIPVVDEFSRETLTHARRVIVKIGSRLLATRPTLIQEVAAQVCEPAAPATSRCFIIVSSGAISLGCSALGYKKRPKQMAKLQAAAAAGQCELMFRYVTQFAPYNKVAAQVLLTHSDLASRRRLTNAQQALEALLNAGAIPVVNEHDTVSTDEIAFGDNDQLASMVCSLASADALFLLTDVDGVLDPDGNRIAIMNSQSEVGQRATANPHGSGGIGSKIEAARKASYTGAAVVIANATEPNIIARLLSGEDLGTLFLPKTNALKARKHWIAYTLKTRGIVLINQGAADALRGDSGSLLPVGVVGVRGQFSRGEAVKVVTTEGDEVARGLTRMGVSEVARLAGKSKQAVVAMGATDPVVVHRDDMVVF